MKKAKDIGRYLGLVFLAVVLVASLTGQAEADTLTYTLDTQYNTTGTEPGAMGPWLQTEFDDSVGGSNTVRVTFDVLSIDTGEYVSNWYINFNDSLDASLLSVVAVNDTDIPTFDPMIDFYSGTAECEPNTCRADGDGVYDMMFAFDTSGANGGVNRFTNGETAVFDITYSGGDIDIYSFIDVSEMGGGQGTYNIAAHVQSITQDASGTPLTVCGNGLGINDPANNGSCSGWLANGSAGVIVPEPVSSTLFLVGAATLGFRRFRKKFRQ